MEWRRPGPGKQPLSKGGYAVSRTLAAAMLLLAVASVGAAYALHERLAWQYEVAIGLVTVLFTAGVGDVRRLLWSYDRYLREWEEGQTR